VIRLLLPVLVLTALGWAYFFAVPRPARKAGRRVAWQVFVSALAALTLLGVVSLLALILGGLNAT